MGVYKVILEIVMLSFAEEEEYCITIAFSAKSSKNLSGDLKYGMIYTFRLAKMLSHTWLTEGIK